MGTPYPFDEAGQWAQDHDTVTRKHREETEKALTEAAGRGFVAPPGETLALILESRFQAKLKATEANAKIFQTMTERRLKEEEVVQKVVLGLARLDTELLKADNDNSHDLAKAWADMTMDEHKAAVQRLESDVEKRQAYIIEERALIEREVTYWKRLAIEAEGITLDAEVQLAREKVKTAEEKLKIIEYLYQVIEAEQVVIAAEIHRAEVLVTVIARQQEVAAVKKTMIPLYEDKAAARLQDAEAIKLEAGYRKQIEELGYRRIDLKQAQEDADHEIRLVEERQEEAHYDYLRAERITEITKAEARTMLLEFEAIIKAKLIKMGKALQKEEKRLKLDHRLFWEQYGWGQEFNYTELQRIRLVSDFPARVENMIDVAKAKAAAQLAGQEVVSVRTTRAHMHQLISKG
jgi:hypothetical protein